MTKINWTNLYSEAQLEDLIQKSSSTPQLIFKHSKRCSLSNMVLNRIERDWQPQETANIEPVFLDILNARDISNAIEAKFGIRHESPQILVIKNGECIYNNSHMSIDYEKIKVYS